MTNICVQDLFIYPFKGLSAQKCACVELEVGHGIRGDRTFALMFKQDIQYPDSTKVPWMKQTGERDISLLTLLQKNFQHTDGNFSTSYQQWYSGNWGYLYEC